MVDLEFSARAKYFIPLALFRHIASLATDEPPTEIEYIGEDGIRAIKSMFGRSLSFKMTHRHMSLAMGLVTRGRLSVQRVESNAWNTIQLLAENGGWEEMDLKPRKSSQKKTATSKQNPSRKENTGKVQDVGDGDESPLSSIDSEEERKPDATAVQSRGAASRKRKAPVDEQPHDVEKPRRSGRRRKAD